MRMHNPPHPGEILKGLWLAPMDVSITDAAKSIGVSRKTLSKIIVTIQLHLISESALTSAI